MNKATILIISLFTSIPSYSHVCDRFKSINNFYYSHLFQNAIINNKPLDYYSFRSECDVNCLKNYFKSNAISYTYKNSNLAVFNKDSVATLAIESNGPRLTTGYITCSSNRNRKYIEHPLRLISSKISLDLQTEDYTTVSRTINLQGYTSSEYSNLIKQLKKLSTNKISGVGFNTYKISKNRSKQFIKISKSNSKGDFMIIIEVAK